MAAMRLRLNPLTATYESLVDAALTRARQARLPSPWTEAVDFLCFPQKPRTPMLNFFARSGSKIEKIDSLINGGGVLL
jgi:hypothetical protein